MPGSLKRLGAHGKAATNRKSVANQPSNFRLNFTAWLLLMIGTSLAAFTFFIFFQPQLYLASEASTRIASLRSTRSSAAETERFVLDENPELRDSNTAENKHDKHDDIEENNVSKDTQIQEASQDSSFNHQSSKLNPVGKKKKTKIEPDQPFIDYGYEEYISKIPGDKTGLRQDLRVVLSAEEDYTSYAPRLMMNSSRIEDRIEGTPRAWVEVQHTLSNLPFFSYVKNLSSIHKPIPDLEELMWHMKRDAQCRDKPIFLSMATVGDDLYWQLIENFVYSMARFQTIGCAIVVCVTDEKCMDLCAAQHFPCYNFQSTRRPLPSVMEQIGELKLFHIPKVLAKGVDVFMLDLDVGFLYDPMTMVKAFYGSPHVDIFVQEDMIFIMNRTKAGWKQWFTQRLPNIGLFLCRGNAKTVRVFDMAWEKYSKMESAEAKRQPGKDQNHVLEGMRYGRVKFGLRYAYFSNTTAVLLDKMNLYGNRSVELGGKTAYNLLSSQRTIAIHMTCYEHTTKVLGLKATNAFWNPLYYDPLRPTLTKSIIFIDQQQLLEEVRCLLWLGLVTNRSVIVPNILGPTSFASGGYYQHRKLWPGFRVVKVKRANGKSVLKVDILEPAFYWRVERDYDTPPPPHVLMFDPDCDNLRALRQAILKASQTDIQSSSSYQTELASKDSVAADFSWAPSVPANRIVLHGVPRFRDYLNKVQSSAGRESSSEHGTIRETLMHEHSIAWEWSQDSVGTFPYDYESTRRRYSQLPSLKSMGRWVEMVGEVLDGVRTCNKIFGPVLGNRSCFEICD